MKPNELELYLAGSTENQSVDFKASMFWNVDSFAKDILAMTNVEGGGLIIIGVKEENSLFIREGVHDEHKKSYNIDIMRDEMAKFAEPHVEFTCELVNDEMNLTIQYIVISIQPFREVPVICKTDRAGLSRFGIYYRNRNRRVESALVSNSYDLRDILERAATRIRVRTQNLGYRLKENVQELLSSERGNL